MSYITIGQFTTRKYCCLFLHFADTSSAADMKCEIKSSCSGCQQTNPMTVDPGSNITLNCSTTTGKLAQGMTWKQVKQEVQNSTGSTDLVLLQSNSSTNSDNMLCDCTAVYFTRMCLLVCLVLIFKIQNCRKLSF